MPTDLAISGLVRNVPPQSVSLVSLTGLPALRIQGAGFRQAESVRINGQPAREWVVLSDREILATPPASLAGVGLSSLQVAVGSPTPGEVMALSFGLYLDPQGLSGSRRAIQRFVMRLLTRRGSRAFQPTYGSRLHTLLGLPRAQALRGATREVEEALVAEIRAWSLRDPPEEQIASVSVLSVGIVGDILEVGLRVRTADQIESTIGVGVGG